MNGPTAGLRETGGARPCLVVVTRNPDAGLADRLGVLAGGVSGLVVVDNGSGSADFLAGLSRLPLRLRVVRNPGNRGLGVALNQGWAEAERAGFGTVLFLDQDSEPAPEMPGILCRVLAEAPGPVAVVGSNYHDVHKRRLAVRCRAAEAFVERTTVITAGSLVPVRVLRALGGFREDYFIDSIDHEFCLRARREGYRVLLACPALMTQRIGRPARHVGLLRGLAAFDHPPGRKYYIARNVLLTVRSHGRREPLWGLRQLVRLLAEGGSIVLFEGEKRAKLSAFLRGLGHGLAGRSGPADLPSSRGTGRPAP